MKEITVTYSPEALKDAALDGLKDSLPAIVAEGFCDAELSGIVDVEGIDVVICEFGSREIHKYDLYVKIEVSKNHEDDEEHGHRTSWIKEKIRDRLLSLDPSLKGFKFHLRVRLCDDESEEGEVN